VEQPADAGRPVLRGDVQLQHLGDLVEQDERAQALPVDLVDEGDDRHVADAADLEQLARLRLDPLGGIDHHDRAIDRGKRPVRVLGEILVSRCVEQVEQDRPALKRHHRAGHGDAALLLDLHPVGPRPAPVAARLDLARLVDRPGGMQQAFGQRRLAGVRVRDDREGPPLKRAERSGARANRVAERGCFEVQLLGSCPGRVVPGDSVSAHLVHVRCDAKGRALAM
jgi:hypothetical protein